MTAKSRDEMLKVRVSATEKKILNRAAEAEGLTLSSWLRLIALRAAKGDK